MFVWYNFLVQRECIAWMLPMVEQPAEIYLKAMVTFCHSGTTRGNPTWTEWS